MADDERVEETGYFRFVKSRRQVREDKARKLAADLDKPLEDHTAEDLQGMVDDLGMRVQGSGAKGAVVKGDLVKALGAAGVRPAVATPQAETVNTAKATPPSGGKPKANTATS